MKITYMKNVFLIATFLFSAMVFSQNQSGIKGNVTDLAMNNEPMLFANIQLKGSEKSYQTNFHGNFEISDAQPGSHTLVISYAGYETQELTVVIEENKISKIATGIKPMQISFDDVVGMDTASDTEDQPKE